MCGVILEKNIEWIENFYSNVLYCLTSVYDYKVGFNAKRKGEITLLVFLFVDYVTYLYRLNEGNC